MTSIFVNIVNHVNNVSDKGKKIKLLDVTDTPVPLHTWFKGGKTWE